MKKITSALVSCIAASLLFCCGGSAGDSQPENSAVVFHDYVNGLSDGKKLGEMHLNNSKLWQGEKRSSFYPFSSRIDPDDLVAHTLETLELKERDGQYAGYGKIWYHVGIFKTEKNAKDAERILINRIRPGKRAGHTRIISEIYRNGREIFFILVGRDADRGLVSPEIRKKGKEFIGLR